MHPLVTKISENERLITASSRERHQHAVNQIKKEVEREGLKLELQHTEIDRNERKINFFVDFAVNQDAFSDQFVKH